MYPKKDFCRVYKINTAKKIIVILKFFLYKKNHIFFIIRKFYNFIIEFIEINKFYYWSIENNFFNAKYYKKKYKIDLNNKKDLFKYYIFEGYKLLHNPSENFSTIIYYSLIPDFEKISICPLNHLYKNQGLYTNYFLKYLKSCKLDSEGFETPIYEDEIISFKNKNNENVKIFGFFLPGFHEDEYNNKFWEKGFTEWNNLKKNFKPLFLGHKYPFKPFYYYNLEDENIIDQQCKMAKRHGIDGFLIFLYDFNNNVSPLYKIIPKLIKILTKNELEFSFLWANEPWTRTWDGLEKNILIHQNKIVSKQQINLFIKKIINFVKQKNYLTIDNKKIIQIYRPEYFTNLHETISFLKEEFNSHGIEIHLGGCNTFGASQEVLSSFDSIMEYPPHELPNDYFNFNFANININHFNSTFTVRCYKKFLLLYINYLNFFQNSKRVFRTIIPSWDNTPRRGKESLLYINYSKSNFTKFLSTVFSDELKKNYKDKIIFINSWNEWGEGAHIEPDQDYGFWKLNTINQIKTNYQNSIIHNLRSKKIFNNKNKNLILLHIYNVEDFNFIIYFVKKYTSIDFLITMPMFKFNLKLEEYENLIVKLVHNEERDFNILYQSQEILEKNNHIIISKIHFKSANFKKKKVINQKDSYKIVEEEIKLNLLLLHKAQHKKNTFIIRKDWVLPLQKDYLGANETMLRVLSQDIKVDWDNFLNLSLAIGGIWTIIDHSKNLLKFTKIIDINKFKLDNFVEPFDGSYCHSLERITLPFFIKNFFQLEYFENYYLYKKIYFIFNKKRY